MSKLRQPPATRENFLHFRTLQTRWMDNDVYGHVNNVVYYSYFDTLVNRFLIDEAGLDFVNSPVIGIVAETTCRFHQSFTYPEDIDAGLAVSRLGRSSVTYQIGLFGTGDNQARAEGKFVHVFVDRDSMRPLTIPDSFRQAFNGILRENETYTT